MSGPSVKVPVDWLDSYHVERLGADNVLLMLTALGWCAEQLSDGVVPRQALRKLWPVENIDRALADLIAADEVIALEDDEFQIVQWHRFILARSEVVEIRAQNATRQERYRRHQRGDHSMCDRCSAKKGGDGVTDGVSNGHPTRSAPIRSDPKGGGADADDHPDRADAPPGVAGTRGNQAPPAPPEDPEQRLGIQRHTRAPGCCRFEHYPTHGIHQVGEAVA